MTPAHTAIQRVVAQQAQRASLRAPHLGLADLTQQGWLVALEALPSWPGHGKLTGWLAVVVYRGLSAYTREASHPVHHPRRASQHLLSQPQDQAEPASQLDPLDMASALAGQLELWDLLVGDCTAEQAGREAGVSARTMRRRKAQLASRILGSGTLPR